jgi:Carboxypeptidase regulatory-like domain/TonB-dependent Receptor Plug Domain
MMLSGPEHLCRMGRLARWLASAIPILLILFWPISAGAQTSTAAVLGTVQDASRAGIPHASIRLLNADTGTENDSVTDGQGEFLLSGVNPGNYMLEIERTGFATTQVTGIALNNGDRRNLLIQMKIGAVTETVQVDASGLSMNTTDAAVSATVDRRLIASIPLNGRTLQDLIDSVPGIVTQNSQSATERQTGTQGEFSVNGQSTNSNAFYVDGVSANLNAGVASGQSRISASGSIAGSTAVGTTQSLVSVDALEEVRVLTSTYSAEYGRTPGGQFTFQTRSGTNQFHGSFYNFLRISILDAQDWFSTSRGHSNIDFYAAPAHYWQNEFGTTLGGPIALPHLYDGHGKSFFFLSYEDLDLDQPTPQAYAYAPQICGPSSLFPYPDCPGFPSYGSPYLVPSSMIPVLDAFPPATAPEILGTASQPTGLANAIVNAASIPSHVNSASVRIDHSFSSKASIFFRLGDTPSVGRSYQLSTETIDQANTRTFTAGATNQLSATRDNEIRFGYGNSDGVAHTIIAGNDNTNGITNLSPNDDLNTGLGIPNLTGTAGANAYVHIVGVGDTDSQTNQESSSFLQWNLLDAFSFEARSHRIKLGVDERYLSIGIDPPSFSVLADFFDRISIANGAPTDTVITKASPANAVLNEFSAFAEDSWQATKGLNLSLGLRWDVNPAPSGGAYTARGDVSDPLSLQLEPRGTPLWRTAWLNFAPRLGAEWIVRGGPGDQLVVRAGAGVFYDTGTQSALDAFTGLGFSTSAHFLNAPIPVTTSQREFSTAVAPPYTNAKVFNFPEHLEPPYSIQWNIGVEQALGERQSLTVSYVGSEGRRLLQEQRRDVSPVNPNFGDVFFFPSGLTSNYQSLQTKFQRSLSHGIEGIASYTWAHNLDYGSTDPAYPLVRGNSDLDVRQNLEASATWDSSAQSHRFFSRRRLLEGWGSSARLIARTGFPVNLSGNFFFDLQTGLPYYSGVDTIPNRPFYLEGRQYPGRRAFNGGPNATDPAFPAFDLPAGTAAGDAPRNFLRGFNDVQANLAIRQTYRVERMDMQFKLECFNIFNHPNFGYIDPYLSDLLFGRSSKMLDQSFGSPGALYDQGGPRVLQLSLKLAF